MQRDRRDFLKLCGMVGLTLACPGGVRSLLAAAPKEEPPYEGPYYLVFNASGGWDTPYLMDPKGTNGINRLYREGDILTRGAHKFAPTARHIQAGLSNEDFYAEFGNELLVLNGLDYSVNNHAPGARYMATGKLDSMAYPTFAALVAACQGPACPLSFLTFGRLRPLHTNAAIFAFAGNALFAGIYYSTQRLCKARMWSDKLSRLHFWGFRREQRRV